MLHICSHNLLSLSQNFALSETRLNRKNGKTSILIEDMDNDPSQNSKQSHFLSVGHAQKHSASLDTINTLASTFSAAAVSSFSAAHLHQQFVDNAQFCSFASNHWIKMSECDEFIGPK